MTNATLNNAPLSITARRVGLISDTHNLVRPAAMAYLEGCDHIIHAGDICNEAVLQTLSAIAPVTAVRGNNDRGAWAERLEEVELLQVNGVLVLVIHDLAELKSRALPPGVRVIVSGHSHKPVVREKAGILYVNPGSAGPRRFKLPLSLGELLVDGTSAQAPSLEARLLELQ